MPRVISLPSEINKACCRNTIICVFALCLIIQGAGAASTELHIQKVSFDEKTVLAEREVDFRWMESNLPVYGDGVTHYYHQGPVFIDD
ncbi:MAG: hypothetical protein LUQ12_01720, partial [Methanoregulaceae archaeon]|nr:hypothetical protein [Methanoregulaceae archaeon]